VNLVRLTTLFSHRSDREEETKDDRAKVGCINFEVRFQIPDRRKELSIKSGHAHEQH
jgi:hypothetical protein